MDSLRIDMDVHGQEISFSYRHEKMERGAWTATIVDECRTIEETLLAVSPDECLDAIVPFLSQLGRVINITSSDINNSYVAILRNKVAQAS